MLRQRVITALVLVALLLGALSLQATWPFALLLLALIAAAAWEWARLAGAAPAVALASGGAMAALGLLALSAGWHLRAPALLWTAGTLVWLVFGTAALRGGVAGWQRWPAWLRGCFGFAVLFVAWLAVAHARTLGVNFLLSTLCIVWMADVAAYFGGRAFGKRKLAPSISPGKSWAGVWSGMAGVLVLAGVWLFVEARWGFDGPSVFARLRTALGTPGMVLVLIGLCAGSVVGDLVESLTKRAAGAKDSSQLLPGHGGVLDRVDALLPVLPAVLAVLAWGSLR